MTVASVPRILIAATSWCDSEYTRELMKLWWRVCQTLNPGEDVKFVDACSPFDPEQFLQLKPDQIFRFEENVGAISRGQGDGAGRGFCKSVELAIEGDYDYVAVYETDFILARPIREIVDRMHKANVKVASVGLARPFDFCEWGVLFINVQYAKDMKVIERYDWQHTPRWPLVEMRLEAMFGDDLWLLPYRGIRNAQNQINVANIAQMFPYFLPDWITHAWDLNVIVRWLDLLRITPEV